MAKKATYPKQIETITHEARRTNIPTAEYQSVMKQEEQAPVRVSYEKRESRPRSSAHLARQI